MTDLEQERAAHAATREELRRAREALRLVEALAGDMCFYQEQRKEKACPEWIPDPQTWCRPCRARAALSALSSTPPSAFSTDAAVRAGTGREAQAVCPTCGGAKVIPCGPDCTADDDGYCERCGGLAELICPDWPDGCGGTGKRGGK